MTNSKALLKTLVATLILVTISGPIYTASAKALANDRNAVPPTRAAKRLAAFHEAFEQTGESSNCINTRRIRDTKIIDKEHILFRLSHGEYALNTLPHTCHSLRKGKAFAYAPISQQLCSVDTITVLDNDHHRGYRVVGPRCGLGQFSTVKKRPAQDSTLEP